MKEELLIFCMMWFYGTCFAQNTLIRPLSKTNLRRVHVTQACSHSGITQINDSTYALVNDNDSVEGLYVMTLHMNTQNGKIKQCYISHRHSGSTTKCDMEAIAYYPPRNTVFIADEHTQQILEYNLTGEKTGRKLADIKRFGTDNIQTNLGFESLCYDTLNHIFWTTTESPLVSDYQSSPRTVRIQSFGEDLRPQNSFFYTLDPTLVTKKHSLHVHGVSDMMVLSDGRLIVMEREAVITRKYYGSYCIVKLFLVDLKDNAIVKARKTLLHQFTTRASLWDWMCGNGFANYEGICAGPKLNDGRQTILLINDSQKHFGTKLAHLKDYIKVLVLENN